LIILHSQILVSIPIFAHATTDESKNILCLIVVLKEHNLAEVFHDQNGNTGKILNKNIPGKCSSHNSSIFVA
jgi:hypothetical protein